LIPKRFEVKIFGIEKSSDLQTLTIIDLTKKLHAQEVSIRSEEAIEGVFQVKHIKDIFKVNIIAITTKEAEGSSRKENILSLFS